MTSQDHHFAYKVHVVHMGRVQTADTQAQAHALTFNDDDNNHDNMMCALKQVFSFKFKYTLLLFINVFS